MSNYLKIKGKKVKIRKEKYYYFYHPGEEKLALATTCYLWMEDGNVARGVAVYNSSDTYSIEEGERWAKRFAANILKGKSKIKISNGNGDNYVDLGYIKRKEAINNLILTKCPFIKKAEKNPMLSWWERRFLFGSKKMKNYKKVFILWE